MQSRLVNPRMMEKLQRDFFPQRCNLSVPVKTQNTAGEETVAYNPVHVSVPCRLGPASGGERRTSQQMYLEATHRILLQGQFNGLTEEWQVELDGQDYDILVVIPDAEGVMTRLMVRLIR